MNKPGNFHYRVQWRRTAALLSGLVSALAPYGGAGAQAVDTAQPAVVAVTGHYASELRAYSRFLPGIREFEHFHDLAPATRLRFGLVTPSFPMKPLPLAQARLESSSFWSSWSQDLPVEEDGWFTIPDSKEAEQRDADVVVSRRKGSDARWVIDVHTPGLPPQVYRLGDLRLECRVYLAIEWAVWHGRLLMGRPHSGLTQPPMDAACSGPRWIFFNTRPWPRLRAYVLREAGRSERHELNGLPINTEAFQLALKQTADTPPWSDGARVEFEFYDSSHWAALSPPPAEK